MKKVIAKEYGKTERGWLYTVVEDTGGPTIKVKDDISGVHWGGLIEAPRENFAEITEEEYMMVYEDEQNGAEMGDLLESWIQRDIPLTA